MRYRHVSADSHGPPASENDGLATPMDDLMHGTAS
jgi:hypothetical protein